jgi:hypothetical protein
MPQPAISAQSSGPRAIERVFLFGVGERDAERAAAGEREVIGVAQVRGLLGVADDLAVVLVLKVEEKNVLIAGDVGRRRRERCRRGGRLIKGQPDIGGGRVVISGLRRVGAIPVGEGGRQGDRHPARVAPAGTGPAACR